jgi:hypothetical protein
MVLTGLLSALALAAFAPYGTAPFEEAARSGRPVLLVVRDVPRPAEDALFTDSAVAPLLQDRFVLVETDALDRPDVVDLAELALLALGADEGAGPVLLLLTPAGKPFAGRRGTVPAEALREMLERGYSDFRERRKLVEERAARVLGALRIAQLGPRGPAPISEALLDVTLRQIRQSPPRTRGGAARLFLLAHHARTGDVEALAAADRVASAAPAGLAEVALQVEAEARTARTKGDPARRAAALAAARLLAAALPTEGALPAGPDGVAADLGLVLQALAAAAQTLEAPELLSPAQRLAGTLVSRLGPLDSLRHREGSDTPGTLDDHAHLALGLLAMDAARGDTRWRSEVVHLVEAALGRFGDVLGGAFFATARATEPLDLRTRTAFDTRLPSGNGTLMRVLLRLSRLTGEARYRDLARRTLEGLAPVLAEAPHGLATVALAMDEYLEDQELAHSSARAPVPVPSASPLPGGPVRPFAVLSRDALRAGDTISAYVRLDMPEGWAVVAPQGQRPLFALTVSVPGPLVPVGRPLYPVPGEVKAAGAAPAFPALFNGASIEVPLRAPTDLPTGPATLLLRLRYQACQGPHCGPPDGATLSVPFIVLPAAR